MTEAKSLFEAESKTLHAILGGERDSGFYIPPYQRKYSWSSARVRDLEEDLLEGLKNLVEEDDSYCFVGSIIYFIDSENRTVNPVIKNDLPTRVYNLIDGQQRLTTLTLFCICLHNQIQIRESKLKSTDNDWKDVTNWLQNRSSDVLLNLKETFLIEKPRGERPLYPRIIRSIHDQWSVESKLALYVSPIASLIEQYIYYLKSNDLKKRFRPEIRTRDDNRSEDILGVKGLHDRYEEINRFCKAIAENKVSSEIGALPSIRDMTDGKKFLQSLFRTEVPDEYRDAIRSSSFQNATLKRHLELLYLMVFASYLLHRVAITVVNGKNEHYAFNVFESLNTTGEPLTAFETFKPKVVERETLGRYESSPSYRYIQEIEGYLDQFAQGDPNQNASRELIINFHLYETGEKVSKKVSEQRKKLVDEYSRYFGDETKEREFLSGLRDIAVLKQNAWVDEERPVFPGLSDSKNLSTEIELCMCFLQGLGHTITIPLIGRFYSIALRAPAESKTARIKDLCDAIRAIVCFSVLWRMSRNGTENIDQEYRELMSGEPSLSGAGGFARTFRKLKEGGWNSSTSVAQLKEELRQRLSSPEHGGISDKEEWVRKSSDVPIYEVSKVVARFILLAAYHDAVSDPTSQSGLIVKGKRDVFPCLTFEKWVNANALSLEHIAPQNQSKGWDNSLYADQADKHKLGNLVFVNQAANSSLGDSPWIRKALIFKALGSQSQEECRKVLQEATEVLKDAADARVISESTTTLVTCSDYMPQLIALGVYGVDAKGEWNKKAIDERSSRLLQLAWDNLYPWLT